MLINLLIGLLLVALSWHFKMPALDIISSPDAKNVVGVVVQIAAVMIGFMVTALSILITIAHQPLIRNMMGSGHYSFLLRRLLATTLFFSAALVVGLYMLFSASLGQLSLCILLATLIMGAVFLADSGRLFWLVLKNLDSDD